MTQAEPRISSVKPRASRREAALGTRLLGAAIRIAVLAMVILVVLLCREYVLDKQAATGGQEKIEAAKASQLAAVNEELHQTRVREQRLLSDPLYLEMVARDRLDLAREGETVIILDSEPAGQD